MRCVVIIVAFLAMAARGDVLYLKDGRQYTGTFVSGNKTWIYFTTDARVSQSFRTRDVDWIEFGTKTAVSAHEREETPTVSGGPATPAETAPAQVVVSPSAIALAQALPSVLPPFPLATPSVGFGADAPADDGAIDSAYTGLGGSSGVLGLPVSVEKWTPDHRAVVRFYAGGDIYWTPDGGAHAIAGSLRASWLAIGGPVSRLGYPVDDEQDDQGGYSKMQSFEGGSINWNGKDGAKILYKDQTPH